VRTEGQSEAVPICPLDGQAKKKRYFCNGEVFFFLTSP